MSISSTKRNMVDNSNGDVTKSINQKLKNTAAYYRFAAKYLAIPFNWTSSKGYIRLVTLPQAQLFWWYFLSFLTIPYDIFLWIDLYYQFDKYISLHRFGDLTIHTCYALGWLTVVCMRLDYYFNRNLKVETVNQILKYVESSIRSNPKNAVIFTKYWDKFDGLMPIAMLVAFFGGFSFSVLVLLYPEHRYHWYFLLIPAEECNLLLKLLFCVVEFLHLIYPWINFMGNIYLITFCIACLNNSLNVLINIPHTNLTAAGPTNGLKLHRMYNTIHILTTIYNQAFGTLFGLPGMKFSCTIFSLVTFSMIILIAGKINPFLTAALINGALSVTLLVVTVLPFAGTIHEKSFLFRTKYKSQVKQYKIMASYKPLAINIGSLYPIKKITTLSYFNLYLANLVNILIAMKDFRL